MHIGDFGVENAPLEATFGWFGSTIRVEPDLTDTVLIDFLARANKIESDVGPEAMQAVSDFLASCIHPDDIEEFLTIAKAKRQGIENLMAVAYSIVEVATDRPTQPPADSSGGQSRTPDALTAKSSAMAVKERFEAQGRADLALVVVQAQEQAAARAAI